MQRMPILTDLDAARLKALRDAAMAAFVDGEADVVPRERIAADIVTVNSVVSFRDEVTETVHRVTLVYPEAASLAERRISILSPVGRALLGRRAGAHIAFKVPEGGRRELRILALHYQPEAAGDSLL